MKRFVVIGLGNFGSAVAEALYRAVSIIKRHPYHRGK